MSYQLPEMSQFQDWLDTLPEYETKQLIMNSGAQLDANQVGKLMNYEAVTVSAHPLTFIQQVQLLEAARKCGFSMPGDAVFEDVLVDFERHQLDYPGAEQHIDREAAIAFAKQLLAKGLLKREVDTRSLDDRFSRIKMRYSLNF